MKAGHVYYNVKTNRILLGMGEKAFFFIGAYRFYNGDFISAAYPKDVIHLGKL